MARKKLNSKQQARLEKLSQMDPATMNAAQQRRFANLQGNPQGGGGKGKGDGSKQFNNFIQGNDVKNPGRLLDYLNQYSGGYEGGLGRVDENTTPEMQAVLDQYRGIAASAGNRSGEMTDYLSTMKEAMKGYDSKELTGLREGAQRGIDTQYKTGLNQQAVAQARGGVRGASATAQMNNLNRERMAQQQNLEQDLFVKGADEKRRARDAYGGVLRGAETDEFGRKITSQNAYAQNLQGAEANKLGRQQHNLDRSMAEKALMSSNLWGMMDSQTQNKQYQQQMDLYNKYFNLASQQRPGGGGGNPPINYQQFFEEAKKQFA